MSSIFQKLKTPLIIIMLLFVGVVVYNNFVKNGSGASLLQKNGTAKQAPDQDLIPLLLRIQNVTLDEKLFLDPVFRALVDFGQPIIPETIGKQNPFAPFIYSDVNNQALESLGFVDESSAASTTPVTPAPTVKPPVKVPVKPTTRR